MQKPMVLFIIIDQSYVSFTFVFSWGYCLRAFVFMFVRSFVGSFAMTTWECWEGEVRKSGKNTPKGTNCANEIFAFCISIFLSPHHHDNFLFHWIHFEFLTILYSVNICLFHSAQEHSAKALKRMLCNSKSYRVSYLDGHLWKIRELVFRVLFSCAVVLMRWNGNKLAPHFVISWESTQFRILTWTLLFVEYKFEKLCLEKWMSFRVAFTTQTVCMKIEKGKINTKNGERKRFSSFSG